MGFFRKKTQEQIQKFKERKAFRGIVAKQTAQAERQGFAKEAEKQARLRGERIAKEKYNRPSFTQRVADKFAQKPPTKIVAKRKPVRRKVVKRRTITRRKPVRRTVVKRRTTTRRKPVRRTVVKPQRTVARPQTSLNQGMSLRELT